MAPEMYRFALVVGMALAAGGCGTHVPEIQENPGETAELLVQAIVHSIHCEVKNAIIKELGSTKDSTKYRPAPNTDFMKDWGAEVALTLTIDDKSTLSPSGLWTPSKIFNLSSGVSASSDATRTEKMNMFYTFADLRNGIPCSGIESPHPIGSLLIQSNLKLDEWLSSEVIAVGTLELPAPGTNPDQPSSAPNVISHDVQFDVTTSGSVTPIWKLVRATVNNSGSLFGTSRDRKHDLLITLGPIDHSKPNAQPALVPQAEASHQAQQIGLSSSTNTTSSTTP